MFDCLDHCHCPCIVGWFLSILLSLSRYYGLICYDVVLMIAQGTEWISKRTINYPFTYGTSLSLNWSAHARKWKKPLTKSHCVVNWRCHILLVWIWAHCVLIVLCAFNSVCIQCHFSQSLKNMTRVELTQERLFPVNNKSKIPASCSTSVKKKPNDKQRQALSDVAVNTLM